ncbi:hypothetical protein EW146_g7207 [Bondarzewia mesenterica]|uniref:ATP-dependent RNA helicase n=1 Tax=Bondarzewia mesenterica TaxID=1095465 RepID=A0A4S4LLZ7_9AGAM|nr:hypothetical protein EW146_g7207 [Bondarzewia mesenterica]
MASSLWSTAGRAYRPLSFSPGPFRTLVTLSARRHVVPSLPSSRRYDHLLANVLKKEPVNLDPGSIVPLEKEDASHEKNDTYKAQPPFSSLRGSVSDLTLKALITRPFNLTNMSPVQASVLSMLPQLSEPYNKETENEASPPRDLLVRAKTGTGKTLAFLIPAIEARLKSIERHGRDAVQSGADSNARGRAELSFARQQVGTLIISPTRELATQIANEAIRASYWHKGFEVRLFTGGTSKKLQMRDWMRGRRDIVVATPGRLRDLLHTEPEVAEGIRKTQVLILDEADTLLEMGFRDDIEAITDFLPKSPIRQTFLFSATLSRAIQQVARQTLNPKYKHIDAVPADDSPVHAHVPQYHTVLPSADHQIPHLLRLIAHDQLTNPGRSKAIVFFPTTKMTQLFSTLLRELSKSVLPAGRHTRTYEIHSKRTQESRASTSDSFRNDKSGAAILVTSDVSARGVDYPGVTRVIQVGIPGGTEQYIHRIGRTGRAGTKGRGDLILLPWEVGFISWQLTDVPMKALATNELKADLHEIAKKHDEDPDLFWKGVRTVEAGRPQYDRSGRPKTAVPVRFAPTLSPIFEDMQNHVDNLLEQIDEDAVRETVGSLLGYYISKTPELRIQKPIVVQGLKDWAVQACGLPTPPYFSPEFLDRLGFSDGRTKHFGKSERLRQRADTDTPHWIGRGSKASKDRLRRDSRDMTDRMEDVQEYGQRSEYLGQRYNHERGRVDRFGSTARSPVRPKRW